MKVLITGGTGTLGREVASQAAREGYGVRIGSRRGRSRVFSSEYDSVHIELSDGTDLEKAVDGVDAVVHAASDPRKAKAVDVEGTRYLVEACRAAGVGHMIYVSIVGVDDIPLAYYRCKRRAEQLVEDGGVPFSILRATQFHSLIDGMFSAAARFPLVMPLPTDFQVQSVASAEVATRLVTSLNDGPSGRLPDFGGPEVMTIAEAAEQWHRIKGVRKRVVRVPIPGRIASGFRAGKNVVPSGEGEHGSLRFTEWLKANEARGA